MLLNFNIDNLERLRSLCAPCRICPQKCSVDRMRGERGKCQAGYNAHVAHYGPHYGEEEPISGTNGSGTIFLSGCNITCLYCQNHDISQRISGNVMGAEKLCELFLNMQKTGVHNINLVSPTHVASVLAEALFLAKTRGLFIPVIYNTGGYDSPDTIRLLDGLIDIYLVDIKYGSDFLGSSMSDAPDYTFYAKNSLKEMYKQVGELRIESGLATKGVLIRHLVLPDQPDNTNDALTLIKSVAPGRVHINLMSQFFPAYKSLVDGRLTRNIRAIEYELAKEKAKSLDFVLL